MPAGFADLTEVKKRGIELVNKVKILGVVFSMYPSIVKSYYNNFPSVLDKMKHTRTLGSWYNRNLSLKGKVVVFNCLIISLLTDLVIIVMKV